MSNSAYSLEYIASKQQYEIKRITAKSNIDITKVPKQVKQVRANMWTCTDKELLIAYVPIIKYNAIQDLENRKKMIEDRNVVIM